MAERSEMHYDRPAGTDVTGVTIARFKRLSWGAIIAGVVIVLVVQATLALLGMAIGFGTVDPATEAQPFSGLATGAMVWWVVSALIALFLGGWVAGRLGGTPRRANGMLHGFLTWGLAMLVMAFLMTTVIGAIMGGALGVLQSGLGAAGQVVAANTEDGQIRVNTGSGTQTITLEDIRREFRMLLAQGSSEGQEATGRTGAAGTTSPQVSDDDMNAALDRLFAAGTSPTQADREAAVNLLVTRANMSRTQAESQVDRWVSQYQGRAGAMATTDQPAGQTGTTTRERAEQQARQTGQNIAETASTAAFWTFIFMVLGAGAAALGGRVGAPREDVVMESTATA